MSSTALSQWRTSGLARLAELEGVHATLVGPGPGRRWGTTQLNRSLFVALVAQFQSFCRDLHDEATKVHVDAAIAGQKQTLRLLIRQGREARHAQPEAVHARPRLRSARVQPRRGSQGHRTGDGRATRPS
ncbi:MAG: hypothetical protein WA797_08930 [Acidimicrobiales bacterium]